jgi:hypothetical protein
MRRLCEVDPEHFQEFPDKLHYFSPSTKRGTIWLCLDYHQEPQIKDTHVAFSLWWMLTRLPFANTDFSVVGVPGNMRDEYVVAPDPSESVQYKGVGPTLADAVIEAYIAWKEVKDPSATHD